MTNHKYYPQLDSLRAFAAIGVINLHWLAASYPTLFGIHHESNWGFGYYGVQLFFVLSGFLITNILIENKDLESRKSVIKKFYIRRILRLFPIYFLFLIFLIAVRDPFAIENIGWFLTYTANFRFFQVGGLIDVWSNHLWTLSIEEQFYLAFPFLILLTPRKQEAIIPILLIVGSLAFKSYYHQSAEPINLLTISQLDMLGAGVGLALIKNRCGEKFNWLTGRAGKIVMIASLVSCLWIFYSVEQASVLWRCFDYLLLVSFSLLVANTAVGFTGIAGRIFNSSILIYLGKVSYGLYLYHKVVPLTLLIFLNKLNLQINTIQSFYLINLSILLIVTHLSWILIERPILRLKSNFQYRYPIQGPNELAN